jgi:hypothetical protein
LFQVVAELRTKLLDFLQRISASRNRRWTEITQ